MAWTYSEPSGLKSLSLVSGMKNWVVKQRRGGLGVQMASRNTWQRMRRFRSGGAGSQARHGACQGLSPFLWDTGLAMLSVTGVELCTLQCPLEQPPHRAPVPERPGVQTSCLRSLNHLCRQGRGSWSQPGTPISPGT